jgi:tetratricopeptide (TPR) repeat protein
LYKFVQVCTISKNGKWQEALNYLNRSLELKEKIGDIADISLTINNISNINKSLGNLEEAKKGYLKALEGFTKLEQKANIAMALHNLGSIEFTLGNFSSSYKLLEDSLVLKNQIGNQRNIAITLSELGNLYRTFGDLEKSMLYYKDSLDIYNQHSNRKETASLLNSIAELEVLRGNTLKAKENYLKALTIFLEYGNILEITSTYFGLFMFYVETGILNEARKYQERISVMFEKDRKNEIIHNLLNLATAIVLKETGNIKSHVEAQELLNEIIRGKIASFEIKFIAMVNLAELLLIELKLFNNKEILLELEQLLKSMENTAKSQNAIIQLISVHILKSKVLALKNELDMANIILNKSMKIAKKHSLKLWEYEITQEIDKLKKKFQGVEQDTVDYEEKMNILNLDDFIRKIQKIKIPNLKTE